MATWPAAYHGDVAQAAELQNVSSTPCYLPAAPAVEVHLSSGSNESASAAANVSRRVDVDNGQYLLLALGSPERCTTAPVATIDVELPGGSATLAGKMNVACSPQLVVFAETATRMNPSNG